jgi:hypothetical protein
LKKSSRWLENQVFVVEVRWVAMEIERWTIDLTLANDKRKIFLEELADAERDGRPAFGNKLSGNERDDVYKDVCASMRSNIRAIRGTVLTARVKKDAAEKKAKMARKAVKKQGLPEPEAPALPTGRTLKQVMDLIEGDEGFEDEVDQDGDSVMLDER